MTTFKYEGKDYTLSMTRAGVRAAEAQGLSSSQITDKPFSAIGLLFFAALYSAYKVTPAKAVDMLDSLIDDKALDFGEVFKELAEEYSNLFGLGESK
jgi:hypothetical protein